MYENIKLEKGFYNLAGKSFTQALEEIDPSENYEDTPIAGLDAFERQLKRFDIKINGDCCDKVEKFFITTESAILFPEFVKRAILQGMQESVLEDIIAVTTKSDCNQYRGFSVVDTTPYTNKTSEGSALPETNIRENASSVSLLKVGRTITTSYEVVRLQRLDVFAVYLRSIGKKLANALTNSAIAVIKNGADSISLAGSELTFSDLTALYGQFSDYDMNTIIVSPQTAAEIISMDKISDGIKNENGKIMLPFGTTMIKSNQFDGTFIAGFDKNYALEMITSSDLIMETDKLIDRQLDIISVSITLAFKKLMNDAVKLLTLEE